MTHNPHDQIHFEAPSLEEVESLLPKYHFESFIAKGGMGAVYKATQISLDRPVAIKVLPKEFGADASFRESFETEAKMMARLNHPNLIAVYDFGEIEGLLYIVMELVPGKSLYEKAYGKAIKQETAIDIIRQICEGLDHAHESGVLHRDIKPANILLKKKIPKIGDFGLARAVGNSESGGVIYGTPGYTAPEVLNSPDNVDQRADIYSVGIMLYELLTGAKPEGPYQAVHTHVDCDQRLDKVIRKAINPNMRLRFSTAKEMGDELAEILRTLSAPPTGGLRAAPAAKKSSVNLGVPGTAARQTGAKLKPAAQPVTPAAKLATPGAAGAAPARPATPSTAKVDVTGNSTVTRNIVIIIILLVAIYVAQDQLSKRKERVAQQQEQIDREEAQRKKEREDIIAAQKAQYQNGNRQNDNSGSTSPKPKPKPAPKPLTKLEALESLKDVLASGRRPLSEMPKETFYLSSKSRMLLYVQTPMTWQQADQWCRAHGAYLATVRDSADAASIAEKIPAATTAWVGAGKAGRNLWAWSDGTVYANDLGLRKTSKLFYVGLSSDAIFELLNSKDKQPFVMEWRVDGSQPGGIRERLQFTRQTLNQIDPIYPPGTYSIGSRNFCLVYEPSTFAQARSLAKDAGGELFVPTDQTELEAVKEFLAETLPAGEMAWIGGQRSGDKWTWITGEPWSFANWDQNYPGDGKLVAAFGAESSPWRDLTSSDRVSYILIEWSKDKAKFTPEQLSEDAANVNASFASLRTKAEQLLAKENTAREEQHAENIKRLEWDIDTYFNGLTKGDKEIQGKLLEALKTTFVGKERLPDEIENKGPSQKVRGFTSYGYDKQQRIEKEFLADVDKIRMAYIRQLKKVRDDLVSKGQITASRSVEDEISAAQKSTKSFLELMGVE
ncbi:Serine/threonine protein kinase [Rubritalea squalenifaciens DSM 18772]|uniref:Serine/threonine protein kinase n=1 Tax=Rubritalea squalenifaciens DSM 18772 TaxID=1123071 RepID=A0A1M6D5F9_9BACT|nr:protein kinase [Rubritalea squalenifaciens]SHI68439.1 Serine/threonine protein kinase [Rubritalea squalenifaciens DSM 18772]